ncbi:MAG: protease modulator HflC [Planctomycetota bacterium]|jgi:membrane protease subunit HflC
MKAVSSIGFILILIVAGAVFLSAAYSVHEREQVIITQFGDPVGEPITEAGLHFKAPFIQTANRFEKRILPWDGQPSEMPTQDKTYIIVDTFARWRVADALEYFRRLRDERSALSRLDDILGSETRNAIASHKLIEVIRSTKDREPVQPETLTFGGVTGTVGSLPPIEQGRTRLEAEILENSKGKLESFGIELLDVRFKRVNYNEAVRLRIYERMVSERQQIAELFRSEGQGEAAKILGSMDKDLKEIESSAYKAVQQIKGEADARATEIYASAYDQSPESADFYEFIRTMEIYADILSGDSTVILSTDNDVFRFLKGIDKRGGDN